MLDEAEKELRSLIMIAAKFETICLFSYQEEINAGAGGTS